MKWSRLEIKEKVMLTSVAFILMLVLVFALPLRRTYSTKKACKNVQIKINDARSAPAEINIITQQMSLWNDQMIAGDDRGSVQLELFGEISEIATSKETIVLVMRSLGITSKKNIQVQSFEIEIKGSFKSLLRTLYAIERNMKYGKVASFEFLTHKVKGKRYDELHLKLLIQSASKA